MSKEEYDILVVMAVSTTGMMILCGFFVALTYLYQKRLRRKQMDLFNAVIDTEEKEQERIARDLHDQLGPLLSIIKTQVECIDSENLSVEDQRIRVEVMNQLQSALRDVRTIAHNLVPRSFSELGLINSLEYYIMRLREFYAVEAVFDHNGWPTGLERSFEVSVYRILQELFQNTLKHAQASKIGLAIDVKDSQAAMVYTDNGKGFELAEGEKTQGIGLTNIANRVKLLNGKMEVRSEAGAGTRYEFLFKLAPHHAS